MTGGDRVSNTTGALLERAGQSLGTVAPTQETGLSPRLPQSVSDGSSARMPGPQEPVTPRPARLSKGGTRFVLLKCVGRRGGTGMTKSGLEFPVHCLQTGNII